MAQKAFTMVFYIVPEDQDDIEQPNAFGIHKNQEDIKHNDITDSFPLPGEYIFRYRYKFQNSLVWMDINSNSNRIPLFNGKIYVKATRISWNKNKTLPPQGQSPVSQSVRQSSSQGQQQAPVKQKVVVQQLQQQPQQRPTQSYQAEQANGVKFNSQGTNGNKINSTNLLDDFDAKPVTQKNQPQTNQFEADLLDMDDMSSGPTQKQNKADDDLWNF